MKKHPHCSSAALDLRREDVVAWIAVDGLTTAVDESLAGDVDGTSTD